MINSENKLFFMVKIQVKIKLDLFGKLSTPKKIVKGEFCIRAGVQIVEGWTIFLFRGLNGTRRTRKDTWKSFTA